MLYQRQDYARLRNAVWLISGIAWAMVFFLPGDSCHGPAHRFGTSFTGSLEALGSRAWAWLLMLVAMMAPMTTHALYQIRLTSFSAKRGRLFSWFILGYGLMWTFAGIPLTALELTAKRLNPNALAPALVLAAIAAVWQASPLKQVCLNQCQRHRIPAAFGSAAEWNALGSGLEHGLWCLGSCWATMLLPMMLPVGHKTAMIAASLLMFCERLDPPASPSWRLRGFRTAFRALTLRFFGPRSSPPRYTLPFPR